MNLRNALIAVFGFVMVVGFSGFLKPMWQSKFVQESNGKLSYTPDEKGNTIPDFSRVGYHQGDNEIPDIAVVKTISASADGESQTIIQKAIDEVSAMPANSQGVRGAILLTKGTYKVPGVLNINKGGIVLRGEGSDKKGTVIIATGVGQRNLLNISGKGKRVEIAGTRTPITDAYVPVGTFSFKIENAGKFKVGDQIVIFRPGTDVWIHDLKMDQIVVRPNSTGTKQWEAKGYDLQYERTITKIEGNKIYLDIPVVMAMESRYGGGSIYKYTFDARIKEVGVENILFKSDYASETDEEHGWEAVDFDNAENCWARNITAQYFGYSCVFVGNGGKNITITDSKCMEAKSQITGGRRYSFNINGQMILVKNCISQDARHDFVTGARVCGPNVFLNCKASSTHADIGPHHRWATGTLFDNITTDGQINIQDRGYMGSGHGWSGANQVLWNCKVKSATVQKPWASATNWCIGLQGAKAAGSFPGRLDGEWEGQNKTDLEPSSLYLAQLKARK
jgi:hypothetical protein